MVSVLNILPKELLVCITNEWLDDTLKDVCSLDVAIANRQLRTSYVLEQWLSTKDGFKKQIQIESDKVWAAVVKWKNMRDLDIKNISLSEYSLNGHYLPHLALFFPHLTEIDLSECDIKLHHIFFAPLAHLRKLSINSCSIVVNEEIVHNSFPTTIEELYCCIKTISSNDTVEENVASPRKCRDIYLWIAKCCPNMKKVNCQNCFEANYLTIIRMVQLWPQLKELEYQPLSLHNLVASATIEELNLLNQQELITKKANLDSIALNYDEHASINHHAKHFVDMFKHCCNPQVLTSLGLFLGGLPDLYQQRLLDGIVQMSKVKNITLHVVRYVNTSTLVDTILTHCRALETFKLNGPTRLPAITLFQAIASSTHCHLNNLKTLQLHSMKITDESLNLLCNSIYAKQLTTLRLKYLWGISIGAYHKVFASFTQLHSFELYFSAASIFEVLENVADIEKVEERVQKLYYDKLMTLLNPLFNNANCAFADTLQELSVNTFCYNTSKWTNKEYKETMLCDHIVPHWKFSFPQLKSCSIRLLICDFQIASFLLKRLLINCEQLDDLEWIVMGGAGDGGWLFYGREVIRRMRKLQLLS